MSDLYKTLLISRPQVLSSGGSGLLVAANNLSDVADVTTARTNLGAASALTVSNLPSTLAASGYVYSDGTTSNRAQIYGPFDATTKPREWIAGAAGIDVIVRFVMPATGTRRVLCVWGPNLSYADVWGSSSGVLIVGIETTGQVFIRQIDSGGGYRNVLSTSNFSSRVGSSIFLRVRITNGVGVSFQVDGSSYAANAETTFGTPVPWLSSTLLVPTYRMVGYTWPAGEAPVVVPVLGSLTDSETESWRTTGRPPVWVAVGGSCASVYTSSFAAGVDSFTAGTGCTIDGNIDSINGQDDWLRAQRTSTTGSVFIWRNMATLFAPSALRAGGVITLRARVYNASATARYVSFGGGGYASDSSGSTPALVPATSQADIVVTRRLRSDEHTFLNDWRIYLTTSTSVIDSTVPAGDLFYFKNIEFVFNGALSLPSVQPILVIDDVTSIEGNQARLLGMIPITERKDWRIVDSTSISGNEPILGGATFLESNRHRIDSWVINNRGTSRTVYLGNQSNGTEYATSFTAGAGLTEVTLATRFNATVNLWCNSNGTDQLVHTITGHRVGSS